MRLVSLFLGLGISVLASLAYAGWSNNPVQISTSSSIPLVEGCNDGAYGTFVAWQDGTLLRVQHLLPSGDLDPAWPAAGAIACDVTAARTDLELLPDGLGGLYLSWIEAQALYLTRLDGSGQTAPGWPARGRGFGPASFPALLADDAHGLFMAWNGQSSLLMIHLGPDNGESGGWSGGAHAVRPQDAAGSVDLIPALARDGSGGAYIAWVRISPNEALVPNAACLLRLGPDGQSANGWPQMGLAFTPFAWDFSSDPSRFVIDVATDGHGGTFLLVGEPLPQTSGVPRVDVRLRRVTSDGDPAPGWTAGGRLVQSSLDVVSPAAVPEVLHSGLDDAVVAIPSYYSEGYIEMVYRRNPNTGSPVNIGLATPIAGRELVSNDQGGFFAATFNPIGPYSSWAPYAQINLVQFAAPVGWQDFSEFYTNFLDIYGDIGLAKTGDGGAVLFWSQKYDRIGLFARRFGPQGETLDAGTSHATFGIQSARFQPGSGVWVRFSSATGGLARLGLFDVTGRRVAAVDASLSSGAREVTIPGTGSLRPGLYFVRLTAGNAASNARITVLR